MSYVVDREAICDMLNAGNIPAINFIPPTLTDTNGEKFSDKALEYGLPLDGSKVEEAKALLEEAGYPNGEGIPTIQYITNTGEGHMKVAQALQQMWKENLGINIEISNMEWAVFQEQRKTHDFEIARGGWIGDYVDPLTFIGYFKTGNPLNSPEWSNSEFDKLIESSGTQFGQERLDTLANAEKILVQDGWFLPIYNYVDPIHQAAKLKNVERTVLGKFFFGNSYID